MRRRINFDTVNTEALNNLDGLLRLWLSDGYRRGDEWVARNPTRRDRHLGSFKINLQTGRWADFATGDAGGDPISLAAYLFTDNDQKEAAEHLILLLGLEGSC